MKKFIVSMLLGLAALGFSAAMTTTASAATAAPTVQDVERAVSRGDYTRAETMLREVVAAHPDSARAHYLYAQVLDHNGRYGAALTQLNSARSLDPSIRFTDPKRFAEVERRIGANARRAGAVPSATAAPPAAPAATPTTTPAAANLAPAALAPAALAAAPGSHGPSFGAWAAIVIVILLIAAVLRWSVRRSRNNDDGHSREMRLTQLKRATDLLDAVRGLKLDLRLSTVAGHELLVKEAEDVEAQLRSLVDALGASSARANLSGNAAAPPEQQLDWLERQVESLKARAEGRPDPLNTPDAGLGADQFGRHGNASPYPPQYPPQYPPGQQPPVQQAPGFGLGGMAGGLLGGALLGEVLGNLGRPTREVIVEDRRGNNDGNGGIDPGTGGGWDDGQGGNTDAGVDFGQGDQNWDSGGGDLDAGNDGGWTDNT